MSEERRTLEVSVWLNQTELTHLDSLGPYRSTSLRNLISRAGLLPELPARTLKRMEKIASSTRNGSLSKLVREAICKQYGR